VLTGALAVDSSGDPDEQVYPVVNMNSAQIAPRRHMLKQGTMRMTRKSDHNGFPLPPCSVQSQYLLYHR
jgi:hypothetical protein